MKICLVSSNLHPVPCASHGAVETQMMAHATGLAELGHEVHVLTVGEPEDDPPDRREGLEFHRLGPAFERGEGGGVRDLLSSQTRFGRRARDLARELAPDIVHWHARYPCLIGLGGPRRERPFGTLYHAHNWKLAENMEYPLLSTRRAAAVVGASMDRRIARRVDHLIGVSRFMADRMIASTGLRADRVSVLTNVVDAEHFCPRGRDLAAHDLIPGGEDSILFVGRIAAEKGLTTLIEAMPAVLAEVPGAALTVVGPDTGGTERGSYLRQCRELVSRLALDSRVRFAGPVPNRELPALLRAARVLAVPSVWGEPCGVVVLEGLACGVPVVASRVGGIPELVEQGVSGLLAPPADPTALATDLVRALRDEGLRARCAEAGPARIAERHTWRRVRDRLVEIYAGVLEGRHAAGGALP